MAKDVQLLMIYAVAKGGKAQEGPIPERNNDVHGLLTHAFMSAIERARPNGTGLCSATRLRDHLVESWDAVCGKDPPPKPEVYLPGIGDIAFLVQNQGCVDGFRCIPLPGHRHVTAGA